MAKGWIKLHRSLKGSAVAGHPEYLAVWIHLLIRASHSRHQMVVGRTLVTLKPGQLVFGRKKFSDETGVSENKIRAALDVLKGLNQITIKSMPKFSIISISKWSDRQEDNREITSNAPAETGGYAPEVNQQITTKSSQKTSIESAANRNDYKEDHQQNHQQIASKPPANDHKQECSKNDKKGKGSQASRKITFDVWVEQIREAGEKPIPDDHAVIRFAEEAGIPHQFLAVCWEHFKGRYSGNPKKYIDWRKVFHNAVRENWFKIWWHDGSGYQLTTVGQQGMNVLNNKQRESA